LFIFVVFNIFENLSVEFSINGLKLILLWCNKRVT
jgi:hypothetical protein